MPSETAVFSTSPSGRYEISRYSHEVFNTCWVETPTITDKHAGETLLTFANTHWSLDDAHWQGDAVVVGEMRKYPGNHEPRGLLITFDCDARQARIGDGAAIPFQSLEASMDASLQWFLAKSEEPRPGLLRRLQKFLRGY